MSGDRWEARRAAASCQDLPRTAWRPHAGTMLTMHSYHSHGRERVQSTLVFVDYHTRPSTHTVVARVSTPLHWGMTVLEASRETLAALLADVDRQLGERTTDPDAVF